MPPTEADDLRPIQAVAALLDGPLSPDDLSAAVPSPALRSPALEPQGARLLMLSALHGAGLLDERFFAALRRRLSRCGAEVDAARAALAEGALLPLVTLLSTRLGINDLRGFLRDTLGDALPPLPPSQAARAAGAALELHRHAQLTPPLFDALLGGRPEQSDAIRLAASRSLPPGEQFSYLFGVPAETPTEASHHLRIHTRTDARGAVWVGAELRTPAGAAAGWQQWPAGQPPSLPMLAALEEGTLLLLALPEPALARIDWEAATVDGQPLGARLVTSRRLGAARPPVALARYNLVEVTAPGVVDRFSMGHAALGRVRMGSRPAFGDLAVVRRTLEGREPVDLLHINAFDAGDDRIALSPGGETLAPSDLTITPQASRYASRRMVYLSICGTEDTVAWAVRLRALGFQAIILPTDPISPEDADAAAAHFYEAALARGATLAGALRVAQQAVPGAAGRLALYGAPGCRLRA